MRRLKTSQNDAKASHTTSIHHNKTSQFYAKASQFDGLTPHTQRQSPEGDGKEDTTGQSGRQQKRPEKHTKRPKNVQKTAPIDILTGRCYVKQINWNEVFRAKDTRKKP